MASARRLFLIAGIYGLAVTVPPLFLESRVAVDNPPAIVHPEYYYGFFGVAAAWQVVFLIIASDPLRYRWIIVPAVLEKLSFGLAAAALYWLGRVSTMTFGFAVVDLAWGVAFAWAFVQLGRYV